MHCDCGFRFSSAWPVFFVEFFNMLIHQTIGCCIWKRIESKNFSWSEPNNVLLGKNPVKRKKSKEKPSFLADWVWFLRNFQKKKDFGFCWQDQILIECFQPFVWISHPSNGSSLLLVGLIFICWNTQIQWIVLRFHSIKAEDKEMKKKTRTPSFTKLNFPDIRLSQLDHHVCLFFPHTFNGSHPVFNPTQSITSDHPVAKKEIKKRRENCGRNRKRWAQLDAQISFRHFVRFEVKMATSLDLLYPQPTTA